MRIDPAVDLVLERVLAAPPALVWRCRMDPALFGQWYLPKPRVVAEAVLDLRAGGRFFMRMAGPAGGNFRSDGCFLEVVPACKLVFTDLMGEDYAPFPAPDISAGPSFTAIVTFAPEAGGTRYRFVARHARRKIWLRTARRALRPVWAWPPISWMPLRTAYDGRFARPAPEPCLAGRKGTTDGT